MTERLGIVYTPVEVVDFIVNSADYALKQEFGVGLTDEGVHILDPFTGTGTFMENHLQQLGIAEIAAESAIKQSKTALMIMQCKHSRVRSILCLIVSARFTRL